jgi:dihydropteroate synthase
MGVVNVTPDSFSDGGRWFDPERAVSHGMDLIAAGANVVDVGGESTRPGSLPVAEAEELRRVVPVIRELAPLVRVSVDTRKPRVAAAAIAAGATLVNDTSATLWPVAAAGGVGWIAMHMRGEPATMAAAAEYDDVVTEVRDYLVARAEEASAGGVREVWIDPGIGFAKNTEHNLALLANLQTLVATGWPVVVGTSRKSFIGRLLAGSDGDVAPDDRLEGSLATAAWAMTQGAAMVRVHDVTPTVHAARLMRDWTVPTQRARPAPEAVKEVGGR